MRFFVFSSHVFRFFEECALDMLSKRKHRKSLQTMVSKSKEEPELLHSPIKLFNGSDSFRVAEREGFEPSVGY